MTLITALIVMILDCSLDSVANSSKLRLNSYGGFAEGVHLFPYRTEKLSPSWPMVLHHNAGE